MLKKRNILFEFEFGFAFDPVYEDGGCSAFYLGFFEETNINILFFKFKFYEWILVYVK